MLYSFIRDTLKNYDEYITDAVIIFPTMQTLEEAYAGKHMHTKCC